MWVADLGAWASGLLLPCLVVFLAALALRLLGRWLDGDNEYWSNGGSAVAALAAVADRKDRDDLIWREDEGRSVLVPKVYPSPASVAERVRKGITMEEVARHNKREDAWLCIEGKAYDVTKYIDSHPGGWLPIADLAGRDVTDAFANYHPVRVYEKLLPTFYIGDIEDYNVSDFVKEHREIRQELLRQGLFETWPSYYIYHGLWCASLFLMGVYMTVIRKSFIEHMLGAFCIAAFWQQSSFAGHDCGHNSISHSRAHDLWWGTAVGPVLHGISLAWWKRSHNVHHVVCNSIEDDPDIQHMPIFAIVPDIFGRFWSTYHEKWVCTDWFARMLVSYQHWLYYPIMMFARFNLYVQSYILLLSRPKEIQHWGMEISALIGFLIWFGSMVTFCLSSWAERIAFLVVSHGLAGFLHVQITQSHFAEDAYHGKAYNDDSDEWFRMQVATTLNVDCPTWMDWFHGGLQFQVEHHLYPRVPRHNLRKVREMVKAFCAKHDIKYKELTFWKGHLRVIEQLRKTAYEARKLTKGNGGFYTSQLYQSFNAFG